MNNKLVESYLDDVALYISRLQQENDNLNERLNKKIQQFVNMPLDQFALWQHNIKYNKPSYPKNCPICDQLLLITTPFGEFETCVSCTNSQCQLGQKWNTQNEYKRIINRQKNM